MARIARRVIWNVVRERKAFVDGQRKVRLRPKAPLSRRLALVSALKGRAEAVNRLRPLM